MLGTFTSQQIASQPSIINKRYVEEMSSQQSSKIWNSSKNTLINSEEQKSLYLAHEDLKKNKLQKKREKDSDEEIHLYSFSKTPKFGTNKVNFCQIVTNTEPIPAT
mmetsp:Transcript_26383/g.25549  ORF Transcript_26383/g.25549 Transcript_26383/m.25549 type:complete len:106 (+) Transcript_26383:342-659(+)